MQPDPQGERDTRSMVQRHRRFQNLVAALFLGSALIILTSIFLMPRPDGLPGLAVLTFVQLPLFLILALIGLNALIRAARGPKTK